MESRKELTIMNAKTNRKNIISVNMIKSYPASCLNRNEDGHLKTMEYNGKRQLVSSASIKNGIKEFMKKYDKVDSVDTRRVGILVADMVSAKYDIDDNEYITVAKIINDCFSSTKKEDKAKEEDSEKESVAKVDSKEPHTENCIRLSKDEITEIYDAFIEVHGDKIGTLSSAGDKNFKKNFLNPVVKLFEEKRKSAERAKCGHYVSMFGRMVTSIYPIVNSSVKVSNGMGISKYNVEPQYYTRREEVISDRLNKGNIGSANMGYSDNGSPTFIETFIFDIETFINNENVFNGLSREDAIEHVKEMFSCVMRAIFESAPTGKQNTDFSNTKPCAVYITVGDSDVDCKWIYSKLISPDNVNDKTVEEIAVNRLIRYGVNSSDNNFTTDFEGDGHIPYLYLNDLYWEDNSEHVDDNIVFVSSRYDEVVEKVMENIK